ncbi:MAG TPA: hypothetical protein VFC41_04350 [Anaerovoracaceae bacterium]|nr:hypothetical protein [Anaerovoracaceae bacterium]
MCQSLSVKLSWSHYCELLNISDKKARSFYDQEAQNSSRNDILKNSFGRALDSCQNTGIKTSDHFREVTKMLLTI